MLRSAAPLSATFPLSMTVLMTRAGIEHKKKNGTRAKAGVAKFFFERDQDCPSMLRSAAPLSATFPPSMTVSMTRA